MSTTLKVLGVPDGRTFVLTPPKQVIGRSSKCDVILEADKDGYKIVGGENDGKNSTETMSRRHAEFACVGGRWTITDLGSMNGTKVNSKSVGQNETYLANNDQIGLGAVSLLFNLDLVSDDKGSMTANVPVDPPSAE